MCTTLDKILGVTEGSSVFVDSFQISQNQTPIIGIGGGHKPQYMVTEKYCDVTISIRCSLEQANKLMQAIQEGNKCVL